MTREEFDAHVREIELRYARRPGALRTKLLWLAALGYAGMLAWFGGVLLLAAIFLLPSLSMKADEALPLWILGGAILIFGGWQVGRVLWVQLKPPEGRVITRTEAPALHAALDGLRTKLRAARFHRVIVTAEWNASVTEIPRLGVFGWPRHYLSLGWPLLENFSPAEIQAVLAHEFAHLSRRHGRIGSWLYRQRRSWEQIFHRLRQPYVRDAVSLRPLLVKFVDWFWPRFNAHAFVLSRLNEYQADGLAAWATGPQPMASALFRLAVYGRLLEDRFWPDFWKRANQEATPPEGHFGELQAAIQAGPKPEEDLRWRTESFRFFSSNADTHPCLSARLKALKSLPEEVAAGVFPPWPALPEPNAATAFFGTLGPRLRAEVEARWRKDAQESWKATHARAASLQHRLESLSQAVPSHAADVESLWDQARTVINLQSDAAAVPLLQQILALQPKHGSANFCLGRHLLSQADETGEAYLERAMEQDDDLIPSGGELLIAHFRRTGRPERVKEIEARLDRHEALLAAAQKELANVTASDTFIPHGLSPSELEATRTALATEPAIATAYLAQKQLKHRHKQRVFVLCVESRRAWHGLGGGEAEQMAANRLFSRVRLPGRVLVCARSGSFAALAKKVRNVPETRIFPY